MEKKSELVDMAVSREEILQMSTHSVFNTSPMDPLSTRSRADFDLCSGVEVVISLITVVPILRDTA